MKIKPMIFGIISCLILLSLIYQTAYATLGSWGYQTYVDIQGTSDGLAGKMINKLASYPPQWVGNIVSLTNYPPVAINIVGWTWWTVRETCDYVVKQQAQGTPVAKSNSQQIAASIYMNTMSCSGTRRGLVLGKHDLHTNSIVWQPEWTDTEIIPN